MNKVSSKTRGVNIALDIFYLAILAFLVRICFNLFGWMMVNADKLYRSDIPAYIMILEDRPGSVTRLIYIIFRTCIKLSGSELGISVFLALLIALICLANHLYLHYYSDSNPKKPVYRFLLHFFSIAVIFTGPIYVPEIHPAFYRLTVPTFAWHSPTQMLLILFSVLATYCFFRMYENYEEGVSPLWWLLSSIFFFLSAYSKPSYILDAVPAIIIVFLLELFKKGDITLGTRFRRLFVMGLSFLASGIYLIIFYIHAYKAPDSGDIVFAPVEAAEDAPNFAIAIVCSLLFPIIVALFNHKRFISDRRYLMIILIAAMGLLQQCLFSETGWRSSHGNFTWGSAIGGYMLILTSMGIIIDNIKNKGFLSDKKALKFLYYLMAFGALSMHLISNIYYFYTLYNGAGFWR